MADEERMKILNMLEEGKIKADEAARLLDAVGDSGPEPRAGKGGGKALHVRVFKGGSDRPNVNVNIPLSLAKWALKFIPSDAKARMGDKNIDLDELEAVLDGSPNDVITVQDDDKNERVEIYVK